MEVDNIIKKELNYDLKVLTYRVIPTGSSDGLIEMMPNSKTLFEILRTYAPSPLLSLYHTKKQKKKREEEREEEGEETILLLSF